MKTCSRCGEDTLVKKTKEEDDLVGDLADIALFGFPIGLLGGSDEVEYEECSNCGFKRDLT